MTLWLFHQVTGTPPNLPGYQPLPWPIWVVGKGLRSWEAQQAESSLLDLQDAPQGRCEVVPELLDPRDALSGRGMFVVGLVPLGKGSLDLFLPLACHVRTQFLVLWNGVGPRKGLWLYL